jgi:hypothetical protein
MDDEGIAGQSRQRLIAKVAAKRREVRDLAICKEANRASADAIGYTATSEPPNTEQVRPLSSA